MKYILAVRHAQSMSNAGLVTENPASIGLTDLGWEQAHKAAEAIRSLVVEPELFVVSKYIRTQQTLEPTRKLYPHVPVETWDIHEFCMLNPKYFSKTSPEQRKPFVLRYWENNDPLHCEGGEAECFATFMTRIETMIRHLQEHPANNIVLFSHEFVLHGVTFLRERTNFEPFKSMGLNLQKELMRDFRTYCDKYKIPNAEPYPLQL